MRIEKTTSSALLHAPALTRRMLDTIRLAPHSRLASEAFFSILEPIC